MFSQGNTDKQRYNIKHMFEMKKITSRLRYKLSDNSVIFVKNRATTKHTGTLYALSLP